MKRTILHSCRCGIFLMLGTFVLSLICTGQEGRNLEEYYGEQAAAIVQGAKYVHQGQPGEYPAAVKFQKGNEIESEQFISWIKQSFKMVADIDFNLNRTQKDNLGYVHYRYFQSYQGIPIDGAEYIVQTLEGLAKSLRGNAYAIHDLNTTPILSEEEALESALAAFGEAYYLWEIDFWENEIKDRTGNPSASYYPSGELMITRSVQHPEKGFRLAYRFDIWALNRDARIFVDAGTGAILKELPLSSSCEAANVNTVFNGNRSISTEFYSDPNYRLYDDCDPTEIWVRDWGSTTDVMSPTEIENTTNTWTTTDERFGGTVLWALKRTWDYYLTEHTHASYDGSDGQVKAYINAVFKRSDGTFYTDNASMAFNGSRLKVGLGSAGTLTNSFCALDIMAHEFTHAVTGTGPGLQYLNESGALNESFSDIFGEMVENFAAGLNDWLGGDDRDDGAIRSFIDPNLFSDPDTYLGTNWYSGASDYGGVHTNCGVQNHWFYLLSEGGTGTNDNGDAFDVDGIGREKAEDIAYRNLILKLTSTSDHADARTGAIEAAEDLYGTCSNEVRQVINAWYAVGVGDPFMDVTGAITGVSCNGSTDGAITLTVTGTAPITYAWNDGPTTKNRTGLSQGLYSVTVTDAVGCYTYSFSVPEPAVLTATVYESDHNGYSISCHGGSDGWAQVVPAGGTAPYSYLWSDGQITQTADFLSAGPYTVTVTDAIGCMAIFPVVMTEPSDLSIFIIGYSDYNGYNVPCNGDDNGVVISNAMGGVYPYSFLWSDGQTDFTATNLSAGLYSVTVTDANGCTASTSYVVTEPPPLTVDFTDESDNNGYNISCNGGSDGWVTAAAGGGVSPYSFVWSNGQTGDMATGLSATTYTVTVTDFNGCTASNSITLTEPDPLTIEAGDNQTVYYGYPPMECATISWSGEGGGVPPYTITWDDSGEQTHEVCPGLITTTYTVTVVDLNGCSASDEVTICVIDVRCGKKLDKVAVCHVPEDDPLNEHTICVAIPSVADHLAHGDLLGDCGIDHNCPPTSSSIASSNPIDEGNTLTAFPNPFNHSTTIAFTSEMTGKATLKLFDLTGREIKALYNGSVTAGKIYEVQIDGSLLKPGISYCLLQYADGSVKTLKLAYSQ